MYVFVQMTMYICVSDSSGLVSRICHSLSILDFWTQNFSLPRAHRFDKANWLMSSNHLLVSTPPPVLGLQLCAAMSTFYVGSGDGAQVLMLMWQILDWLNNTFPCLIVGFERHHARMTAAGKGLSFQLNLSCPGFHPGSDTKTHVPVVVACLLLSAYSQKFSLVLLATYLLTALCPLTMSCTINASTLPQIVLSQNDPITGLMPSSM